MPLSKEAIQLITDTALIANGKALGTNTPTALIPEGTKIVDLEKYEAQRSRFRGTLSTNSLKDFGKYVIARNITGAAGFVDQDEMSCVVLFNLGDVTAPGHADDRAILRLKPSAGYKAVQAIPGRGLSQKELSDWIEDWNGSLIAIDENGATVPIVKAIAAVRTITIKATSESETTVSDTSASRSAMDQIEARSRETLPSALVFSAIPFEGLTARDITLRIAVITSGNAPVLKLRWVGEEVQREEIAQEFKAVLDSEVGGFAKLTLGTFDSK